MGFAFRFHPGFFLLPPGFGFGAKLGQFFPLGCNAGLLSFVGGSVGGQLLQRGS